MKRVKWSEGGEGMVSRILALGAMTQLVRLELRRLYLLPVENYFQTPLRPTLQATDNFWKALPSLGKARQLLVQVYDVILAVCNLRSLE